VVAAGADVSAAALARAYLAHLKALGVRPQTLEAAALALSRFFEHLRKERVRDVRRVGEAHLVFLPAPAQDPHERAHREAAERLHASGSEASAPTSRDRSSASGGALTAAS
jgi:hypothetical protein